MNEIKRLEELKNRSEFIKQSITSVYNTERSDLKNAHYIKLLREKNNNYINEIIKHLDNLIQEKTMEDSSPIISDREFYFILDAFISGICIGGLLTIIFI